MFNYEDCRVLLICGSTDCRKSIDGISSHIMLQFDLDLKEPTEDIIEKPKKSNKRNVVSLIKIFLWK